MFLKSVVSLDWQVLTGKFVEGFSKIATPLTNLLKKDQKFELSDSCQHSFEELRQRLMTAPKLALPSGKDGYVVYSDASRKVIGCVLMQDGRVIAYVTDPLLIDKEPAGNSTVTS